MRTQLRPGEEMVLETRTHWLTVVKPFLVLLLGIFVFILCFFLVRKNTDFIRIIRWLSLVLLAGTALNFIYREFFRRRDIWAVTNLRVIDEKGVFSLYTKESPLEKINNLSYRQSFLGRILNYGDVEIQTAAEDGATIYPMVAGPKRLKDTVAQCREKYGQDARKTA